MRIQHNIMAMNAYRNYNTNTSALSKNLEKLSSGYKINRAGDDAAGLAISEKMRAQITGLNAAQKNVKDGVSLVKTAEGAMQEIQDMLNRMDYLATQSANGTYDDPVDRLNLQKEVNALRDEINRIADSANFNGIKLLDGSLDTNRSSALASAVSGIETTDYAAAGPSDAFKASYVTNRPAASTTQTNAKFTVSLDDTALANAKAGDKLELTIGDATIEYEVVAADEGNLTAATLATKFAGLGFKPTAANVAEFTSGGASTSADADGKDTTANWDAEAGTQVTAYDADAKYLKVEGHWYKMTASTNTINFEQVDYMGESGEVINPDFEVGIKQTANGTGSTSKLTGTVNWQNQKTTAGTGIGSSHQAQATVDIDFTKLKDGDVLTVGEKNYVFKIGAGSGTTAGSGQTLIDLSGILKEEADLSDKEKLEQAMVKITGDMGAAGSTTWTAGNKGVSGTTGTLTFQSLSTYADDAATVGSVTGGTKCNMTTEDKVMAQFQSTRAAQNATASFDLDVTKIKNGDTITIDGVTFEFSDSDTPSTKGNIAVDLSAYGISDKAGSIAGYQTANVVNALKTAINSELNYGASAPKYTITSEGNKVTLTSNDNTATSTTKENMVSATITLPEGSLNGKGLVLQIGDTSDDFNQLAVSVGDMHTTALKIDGIDISNQQGAKDAIQTIKDAINYVSEVRGTLGATQNRLEHTANNLSVMAENIQDAESTIRDTDIAEEMMAYTKNNILVQSAQAMLAQANAVPQGVLQLLG